MGEVLNNARIIVDDLKNSWYFRFWALFWTVCAVMTFAGLIVYGGRSTDASKHEAWQLWFQQAEKILYPQFQLRTVFDEQNNVINTPYCTWGNALQPIAACPQNPDTTACIQVTPTAEAVPMLNDLECLLNVTAPQGADRILAFDILDNGKYGAAMTFLNPSNNVWIVMDKISVEPKSGPKLTFWSRRVQYETTLSNGQYFKIVMVIDTFAIWHYVETDWYTGMMAVADVGGLAFFLYILHTITMMIIGIFLDNNSKFLGGSQDGGKVPYNQIS